MKKIGILTFHFVKNYGALLQAAALHSVLKKMGHAPFFIDYRPDHIEQGGRFVFPSSIRALKANAKIIHLKVQAISEVIKPSADGPEFDRFTDLHLPCGDQVYATLDELIENPPVADLYICGSDQIWNKSLQFGFDPAYFLRFGDAEIPKASYAASFGRGAFEEPDLEALKLLLDSLSYLTVREKSGQTIACNVTGRDAALVPDPTLLMENIDVIELPTSINGPYIFTYALRSKDPSSAIAKIVANISGHKVITCEKSKNSSQFEVPDFPVGPAQWISLIRQSEFVVTNSYHGTVFAILMRRPFITAELTGAKSSYNERSKSLLEAVGLLSRMTANTGEQEVRKIASELIDWDQVHLKLQQFRQVGLSELAEICALAK